MDRSILASDERARRARAIPSEEVELPANLPSAIAEYFATDQHGDEMVARCFTTDAVVKDEGRTYRGRPAIARWLAESAAKYEYTSTPIAVEETGDEVIVTSHLAGNFPGSPIDLRYHFRLSDGKIAALETAS